MNNSENSPKMPSECLTPDTPGAWFKFKFPGLADKFGEPIHEEKNKDGKPGVRDFCEDFFAAALGNEGFPDAPTVYFPAEDRFLTYFPSEGIFIEQRETDLAAKISQLFLECARACQKGADVKKLEFDFRDTARINGIIKRAKSRLAVPPNYFSEENQGFIICKNGVLRLADKALLPFSPKYRRRNKLAVNFDPTAKCPLFLEILMRPALDLEDLALVQRWCGLALLGINHSQKILILNGTAGGGKGTFFRVLHGIIGGNNIGSLRTGLLQERFELSRMLGKTLLYGPDVPENFLNCKGASVLKALTGGDPVNVELKGSNERPEIICRFNRQLTKRVQKEFNVNEERAYTIAHTEEVCAHNQTQMNNLKASGYRFKKCATSCDELVRPSHKQCKSIIIPVAYFGFRKLPQGQLWFSNNSSYWFQLFVFSMEVVTVYAACEAFKHYIQRATHILTEILRRFFSLLVGEEIVLESVFLEMLGTETLPAYSELLYKNNSITMAENPCPADGTRQVSGV